MGTGIQICGLNGCGKSTLGRALAERIGFHTKSIEENVTYIIRALAQVI